MQTRVQIVDKILGVNEYTDEISLIGSCDICIQGLTSGSVKLQYKLRKTDILTDPQWVDFPDGSFISDTYTTIFISDYGVKCRLIGVGNNITVYTRLSYKANGVD